MNQHGIHAVLAQYSDGKISTADALFALGLKDFDALEKLMLNHYIPYYEPSEEEISEQMRVIFSEIYKQDEQA